MRKIIIISICFVFLLSSCKRNETVIVKSQNLTQQEVDALEQANRILVANEKRDIDNYIDRYHLNMEEKNSGLRVQIVSNGEGPNATIGDIINYDYSVSLINGTECYNSENSGPEEFELGKGVSILGLEEGFLSLNQGCEAVLIIPSHLAYGLPGDGNLIPKRASLIYEIKLNSIK